MIRNSCLVACFAFVACATKPPARAPEPLGYVIEFKPAIMTLQDQGQKSKLTVTKGADKKVFDLPMGCGLYQNSSEVATAFFVCPSAFAGALYSEDLRAVDLATGKSQVLIDNVVWVVVGAPKDVFVAVRNRKPIEEEKNSLQLVVVHFDPKTQNAKVDRVASGAWLPSMTELELTAAEEGSERLEREYQLRLRIDGRTLRYRKNSSRDFTDYAL